MVLIFSVLLTWASGGKLWELGNYIMRGNAWCKIALLLCLFGKVGLYKVCALHAATTW